MQNGLQSLTIPTHPYIAWLATAYTDTVKLNGQGSKLFKITLACLLLAVGNLISAQVPAEKHLVAEGGECLTYALSLWGDAYKTTAPNFQLDVRVVDEAVAMQHLTDGSIQLAMLARDASAEELGNFRNKHGYLPTRVAVAMDALVVVVNKQNPLQAVRIEQMDAIYSTNRTMGWPKDILTWEDLGVKDSTWAKRSIVRYARTPDSSVFGLILMYFPYNMTPRLPFHSLSDGMAMAEALAADPDGICSANLVEDFASLKILPMYPTGSNVAVAPTPDTVSSGAYPYSRCLYIYFNKHPKYGIEPTLKAYLAFGLSPEGQQLVKAVGQAPLPRDLNALNLLKVTDTFSTAPSNSLR